MSFSIFLLVLTAAFFHAVWNFSAKKVSGNLSVIWISLPVSLIITIPFAWYAGLPQDVSAETMWLAILSGVPLTLYFLFLGKAYELGDISTVYPIARGIGVLGTAIFGVLLLQEHISFLGFWGAFATCIGIFLMAIKKFPSADFRAVRYAILVGLTIICYSLLGKRVVAELHPFTYSLLLTLLEMAFLAPFIFYSRWKKQLKPAWEKHKKEIFIIGIGSTAVYTAILFAFQFAPASYVVAVRETSVIFGALFGFWLLREKVTPQKILGIIAIVFGVILIKLA